MIKLYYKCLFIRLILLCVYLFYFLRFERCLIIIAFKIFFCYKQKKIKCDQDVNYDIDFNSTATSQQIKSNIVNENNKNQIKSTSKTDLNSTTKKKFKIPADIKISQVRT